MDERTPLFTDPEAFKPRASDVITVYGLRNALHAFLAASGIPPFAYLPNPQDVPKDTDTHTLEYERILALHGHTLLSFFPKGAAAGLAPSASSSQLTADVADPALYLCALLALLLSLNVRRGSLKTEASVINARKHLSEATAALLDDHIEQAARDEEGEGAYYADLLFTSLPTGHPDQRLSAIDLLLHTVHLPKSASLRSVVLHPCIARAIDHMWNQNSPTLLGQPPRYLFGLHYLFYIAYALAAIVLALTPTAAHYYSFNPLVQRWKHAKLGNSILWYSWAMVVLGWAVEVAAALARGPMPYKSLRGLPLPPGSYSTLLPHSFVALFVLLRFLSGGNLGLSAVAYSFLAWSAPLLLLAIFIFPVGLPSLNPSSAAVSLPRFRAIRVVNDRMAVFSPLVPFMGITLAALFWAVNGEVERYDPSPPTASSGDRDTRVVSPIEVRSSLAVGLLAVCLLGWLMGDALITTDTAARQAEIASAALLERARIARYFTPDDARAEPVPLPSPLNLGVRVVGLVQGLRSSSNRREWRRQVRQHVSRVKRWPRAFRGD